MKLRTRIRADIELTAKLARRYVRQRPAVRHIVACAWYRKSQWKRLLELEANPKEILQHYEDWLASAETAVAKLRGQGVTVEKVPINVEVAAKWCVERGRQFNSEARAEFARQLLRRRLKGATREPGHEESDRVVEQMDAADEVRAQASRPRGPRS